MAANEKQIAVHCCEMLYENRKLAYGSKRLGLRPAQALFIAMIAYDPLFMQRNWVKDLGWSGTWNTRYSLSCLIADGYVTATGANMHEGLVVTEKGSALAGEVIKMLRSVVGGCESRSGELLSV